MPRFSRLLAVGISVLAAVSHAATIPSQAQTSPSSSPTSSALVFRPDVSELSPSNWTMYSYRSTTDLTTAHLVPGTHQLAPSIPKTAVVLAVLYTNVKIVETVCAASIAIGGPLGLAVCAGTAILALIISFFAIFRPSSGRAGLTEVASLVRRIDETPRMLIHRDFSETDDCDKICQFKANMPHKTWTTIGNITVDGMDHDVHFSHNGRALGIRTMKSPVAGNSKRDDPVHDVVATYYWDDQNERAFNDFDVTQMDSIVEDIGNYYQSSNGAIVCADLVDQDGAVNVGMMSIDANDAQVALEGDQYDAGMAYCLAGDPNVPST
ncbi:hypothetical protein F5Y12DRAFT_105966 [Xylaria sp. FL1777]|nr:hypothetical protein F5Y12DRAFT_105966 [Xylaria sp. FL1777]